MSTASKPRYKVIGTRPIRHDGVDKVTGRAKYGADFKLTGMLYGAMLRSPHAHARIKRIDTSKAEAVPARQAAVHGWAQLERRLTAWFCEHLRAEAASPVEECRALARRLGVEESTS